MDRIYEKQEQKHGLFDIRKNFLTTKAAKIQNGHPKPDRFLWFKGTSEAISQLSRFEFFLYYH